MRGTITFTLLPHITPAGWQIRISAWTLSEQEKLHFITFRTIPAGVFLSGRPPKAFVTNQLVKLSQHLLRTLLLGCFFRWYPFVHPMFPFTFQEKSSRFNVSLLGDFNWFLFNSSRYPYEDKASLTPGNSNSYTTTVKLKIIILYLQFNKTRKEIKRRQTDYF